VSRIHDAALRRAQRWWRVAFALVAALSAVAAQGGAADASAPPLRFGVFFWHDSPNDGAAFEGIRAAFEELGRPHVFVVERANEDPATAAQILERFRASGPDLVFALGTEAALLAGQHLQRIPVVFTAVTDPVESGVVHSWNGSGRNLAGNSNWIAPATTLHVFRLTVPHLRRLGVLRSHDSVVSAAELRSLRAHLETVPSVQLQLVEASVEDRASIAAAVEELVSADVQAIWIPIDRLVYENTPAVCAAACEHGLPVLSSSLEGTRSGAIAGVIVDYVMLGKRAAAVALAILDDGRNPGTLRVGTMHGYRVVVNTAAARRCGYQLPLSLLLLADVLLEGSETNDEPRSDRK